MMMMMLDRPATVVRGAVHWSPFTFMAQ